MLPHSGKMLAVLLFLVFVFATAANADTTIYNNFGATPPGYTTTNTGDESWTLGYFGLAWAVPFTPSGDYSLNSLILPLYKGPLCDPGPPCPNGDVSVALTLALPSDSPVVVPIESWTISSFSNVPTLYTLDSLTHPMLVAGQEYFVVLYAGDGNFDIEWSWSTAPQGTLYRWWPFGADPGWSPLELSLGAVQVTGDPVPEPATLALLAPALALVGALRRRLLALGCR
jgi:PEP-CTERM motif